MEQQNQEKDPSILDDPPKSSSQSNIPVVQPKPAEANKDASKKTEQSLAQNQSQRSIDNKIGQSNNLLDEPQQLSINEETGLGKTATEAMHKNKKLSLKIVKKGESGTTIENFDPKLQDNNTKGSKKNINVSTIKNNNGRSYQRQKMPGSIVQKAKVEPKKRQIIR